MSAVKHRTSQVRRGSELTSLGFGAALAQPLLPGSLVLASAGWSVPVQPK